MGERDGLRIVLNEKIKQAKERKKQAFENLERIEKDSSMGCAHDFVIYETHRACAYLTALQDLKSDLRRAFLL